MNKLNSTFCGIQEMSMQKMQVIDGGNASIDTGSWAKGMSGTMTDWVNAFGVKVALIILQVAIEEDLRALRGQI